MMSVVVLKRPNVDEVQLYGPIDEELAGALAEQAGTCLSAEADVYTARILHPDELRAELKPDSEGPCLLVTTDGGLIDASERLPTKEEAWLALARWSVDHPEDSAAVIEAGTGEHYCISPHGARSVLLGELEEAQKHHAAKPEEIEREDALLIAYRYALQACDEDRQETIGRLASMENEDLPAEERHRLLCEALLYPLKRGALA